MGRITEGEKMAKGRITVDEERCQGCGLCVSFCTNGVIEIDSLTLNAKGYHPAAAKNPLECTGCSICALMCPDVAIIVERGEE